MYTIQSIKVDHSMRFILLLLLLLLVKQTMFFPRSNVVELFTGSIYEEKNVSLCVFNAEYVMRITFK